MPASLGYRRQPRVLRYRLCLPRRAVPPECRYSLALDPSRIAGSRTRRYWRWPRPLRTAKSVSERLGGRPFRIGGQAAHVGSRDYRPPYVVLLRRGWREAVADPCLDAIAHP